jgi:Zn-dependent protease
MFRGGFRIGRVFGIEIRVAWSWLIILGLVTRNLSSVFGNAHPDWGAGLRWGLGFMAALLLFASVLTHELAHSVVARSRGIPVDEITLFLFGGAAQIKEEPESAGGEFLMAIVGPVTSLVIGGGLLLLAGAVGSMREVEGDTSRLTGQLSPFTTLVFWLGSINVVLGLFNLIPGFPLDGGRVLRSIVWAITGSFRTATVVAAGTGLLIGWLMIIGGGLMIFGVRIPFFGTGFGNGQWLALIGWFLQSGALRHLVGRTRQSRPLGG